MKTKYMTGNWIKGPDGKVSRIYSIDDDGVHAKPIDQFDAVHMKFADISGIRLDDDFFIKNGYTIDEGYDEDQERHVQHIVAGDYIGPSVTKYSKLFGHLWSGEDVEYCITGIIIRTVDEFQNLMNICHCENIAEKVEP